MNGDVGYTSWSLICRDINQKLTTCSVLIDSMKSQYTDIQWTKSSIYVTVDELEILNFDSIIKEAFKSRIPKYLHVKETVIDIQKLSEIKDGSLLQSYLQRFTFDAHTIINTIDRVFKWIFRFSALQ